MVERDDDDDEGDDDDDARDVESDDATKRGDET